MVAPRDPQGVDTLGTTLQILKITSKIKQLSLLCRYPNRSGHQQL
jgi:hypothetical protein